MIPVHADETTYSRIKPTPGRLAVRPVAKSDRTRGGLWIPNITQSNRSVTGEVVAISESVLDGEDKLEPLFKVGDVVLFGQYNGSEITVGREKVIILLEKDIMALLTPESMEDLENAEIGDR